MCGICGFFNFDGEPPDRALLGRMNDAQQHRGPDDEGQYIDGPVALGHRRLSIIDLEGGHQPMCNENGSVWVSFNGEIYNFKDLRQELSAKGHRFKTSCDTEVLVHLYEQEGIAAAVRLNGIFSYALWDSSIRKLFIVRDRFGVKPVYYTVLGNRLLFASEIKSILQDPSVPRRVSEKSVQEYFTFQNYLEDHTMLKDVNILPAATILTCGAGGVRTDTYWELRYPETPVDMTMEQASGGFLDFFTTAVRRQLMSDVPLGGFLSGGMDTSAVVSIAAGSYSPFNTFNCCFDLSGVSHPAELRYDERQHARDVAGRIESIHHELELSHDTLTRETERIVWYLDEPRMGISYPPYCIARLASDRVKVCMAGHGGDEFYAGYPFRHRKILGLNDKDAFNRAYYNFWNVLIREHDHASFFDGDFFALVKDRDLYCEFENKLNRFYTPDPLNRALGFDAAFYLHGLLVVEDKLTMAHSLECRVPFLDNDLVDFCLLMPPKLKLNGDSHKLVMRKALEGLLPDAILKRNKMGFGPPDGTWYSLEPNRSYILDVLTDPRTTGRGYFNQDFINSVIDDQMSGRQVSSQRLWSLVNFEIWNRLFIDNSPSP